MTTPAAPNRIFIIGAPRSGTTWVAKLFDAHPCVLYRHEPDSTIPNHAIPGLVPLEDQDEYLALAGEYIDRLYGHSTVKTNGAQPAFHKIYRGHIQHSCNRAIFYLLRSLEAVPPIRNWVRRVQIPDCIDYRSAAPIHRVVKSVIAGGRAALYARARPDDRFILVLRHPAGCVASQLRGARLGQMKHVISSGALSQSAGAIERGLSKEKLQQMSPIEQLSWAWLLSNEKLISETRTLSNCLLVNYDSMCEEPLNAVKKMYAHAGLDVAPQSLKFLDQSQTTDPKESAYFSIFRDPHKSANKWRNELSAEQIEIIRSITQASEPGSLFVF